MKNIKEENIPGLKVTKKSQTDSAKSNKNYYKDTSKKMGDYDKNSKQEDKDGIDPVKHNYEGSESEYHDQMEIMNGQEMINYDRTNKQFSDRALEAIEGSSRMGNNPEWANVVTDDQAGFTGPKFGKKLAEKIRQSIKKRNSETEKVKFFGDYPYDTEKTSKNYAFEVERRIGKLINEGASEKAINTIKTWSEKLGNRDAAYKLIDTLVSKVAIFGLSDLSDSSTLADGLDEVENLLESGDYNNAYEIAKEIVQEILEDEFGNEASGLFNESSDFELDKNYTHFAIFKSDNKIVNGWDYNEYYDEESKTYDNESIKDYSKIDLIDNFPDNKVSEFKIVGKKHLDKLGIDPSDTNNWYKISNNNTKEKEMVESIKRLKFKKPFNGIKNAVKLIPENYRIDNKVFEITDGNEKYRLRWEGDNKKGKVVVLLAQNKNLINEDVDKIKHLMNYKSHKTLGNLKNNERLTENEIFNNLLNKTKKIIKEDFGEEIESSEPNEVENLYNNFIQAMDGIDDNLSNEIFADVVIKIIKEDYGSHLFETFLNKFNSELITSELESETTEEPLENSDEESYDRFNEVFYK